MHATTTRASMGVERREGVELVFLIVVLRFREGEAVERVRVEAWDEM